MPASAKSFNPDKIPGASPHPVDQLQLRVQFQEGADYPDETLLVVREFPVHFGQEIQDVIALDDAGDPGQRFQEQEQLPGHLDIRGLFEAAGGIILIQGGIRRDGQGAQPDEIRVDPV